MRATSQQMTDEEKQKEAPADSTSEEKGEDKKEPEKADDKEEPGFDYGKEYDRVSGGSKYSPAEKAIHSAKNIAKELKKHGVDPSTVFTSDEDKESEKGDREQSIKHEDVQKMISEGIAKERSVLFEPLLDAKVSPISRSKEEAKLIKFHANKFIADGVEMDEAVEMAWYIANRHRFKETFAEITRGKAAEKSKTDGAGSGQRKTFPRQEPTGKEAEFARNRGLVWEEQEGRYVSPSRKTFLDKQRKVNS